MSRSAGPWPRGGRGTALLLAAVLLTGLNLRGAIAAVAPVLPEVRADLDLSPTTAGLVTTLPVLCFAVLAPPAAWLGRRLGPDRAVLAGLLAIAAGTGFRVLDGGPVLLAGTVLVGAAMTLANVSLPAVVKRDFGDRAGTVTGLSTAALAAGAALTAALTAPLAVLTGWRAALAAWAGLAVVAAVLWAVATRRPATGSVPAPTPVRDRPAAVWRSPLAWAVSAVLTLHAALYYAFTAWLPSLLVDELGGDLRAAAVATALFHVLGIPGTLVVPAVVARRRRGQRGLAVAVGAAWAVLPAGLLLAPDLWPVWAVAGGVAQGAGISLAFTLVVLRSADEATTHRLSGMSQLLGYTGGAVGPLLVGAVHAATGGWTAPLLLLLGAASALAGVGAAAGSPRAVAR